MRFMLGAQRHMEGCAEVCRDAQRGVKRYAEGCM